MSDSADRRKPVGGRRINDLADPDARQYARVSAVAAYFDVDRRTVEKWHQAGHLPIRNFEGVRRIALADVRAFRDKHHPQTTEPT